MKKIVASIAMVWGCLLTAQAQAPQKEVNRTVQMDTIEVNYKTRYISSFWDNFYIEADFAGFRRAPEFWRFPAEGMECRCDRYLRLPRQLGGQFRPGTGILEL